MLTAEVTIHEWDFLKEKASGIFLGFPLSNPRPHTERIFLKEILKAETKNSASRTPPHTLRNSSGLGLFRPNLEEIPLVYDCLYVK
jgi:hypothetical protein